MAFELRHVFFHKKDTEECKCFDFLNKCCIKTIEGMKLNGKNIYNNKGMAYYPFWMAITNNERFIPYGTEPELTIIDPVGIYRIVSCRTYMKDSIIYFDSMLRPLHHIYSHKSGFKENIKTYEIEKKICDSYPNIPKDLDRPYYMLWTYRKNVAFMVEPKYEVRIPEGVDISTKTDLELINYVKLVSGVEPSSGWAQEFNSCKLGCKMIAFKNTFNYCLKDFAEKFRLEKLPGMKNFEQ